MSTLHTTFADDLNSLRIELGDMRASGMFELPPLPEVLLKMRKLVSDDNYGAADLAAIARTDPTVSATVLRYAQRSTVQRTSVGLEQAIARVGSKEMLRIAYAATLGKQATGAGVLDHVRQRLWQRAVTSAILCEHLACSISWDAETAFLAGLLHDFGQVVAAQALETLLRKSQISARPACMWLSLIETEHAQIGREIAEHWELPWLLCEVIGEHHGRKPDNPLTALVAQSDRLVAALEAKASVTPDAIAKATLGGPAKLDQVMAAVEQLPALVSALTERESGRRAASLVELETPTVEATPLPSTQALVTMHGKTESFDVMHADRDGVTLRGRHGLQANHVLSMTLKLHTQEQTFFWNVMVDKKVRGRHLMKLHPFALQGDARHAWWNFVHQINREIDEVDVFALAAS